MLHLQTVALMGAHTMGGTFHNNSGFIGVWSPEGPTHFDNGLYTKMLDPSLTWEDHVRRNRSLIELVHSFFFLMSLFF